MSAPVPSRSIARFRDLALAGAQRQAVRLVLDLLDRGVPAATLITDLIGEVQEDVGERWHRAEWSTADEHVITGVSQAALDALASTAPDVDTEGMVVVACAEGDWHSLPSQMFAELLRTRGQGVVFLGGSTPATDVARFLGHRRPDALAVTSTLALSYAGVARLVDAAHSQGVPVLAGGSALTAARAVTLGADAWALRVSEAMPILRAWRETPPDVSREPVRLDPVGLDLDARASSLADEAFATLEECFPPMRDYDERQRARTREDLEFIVRYLAAAHLTNDPEVFVTFRQWLEELLTIRGVPAGALTAGLASLAPLLNGIDRDLYGLPDPSAQPRH